MDIWEHIIAEALRLQKIKYVRGLGNGAFEIPHGVIFSAFDVHMSLERQGDLQTLLVCQIGAATSDVRVNLGYVDDVLDPHKFNQYHIKKIGNKIKFCLDALVFCEKFEHSPLRRDQK